ncbi:hypothetical protein JHJ32_06735 [Parapedobacter sp. ISTM3]|uniref:hypothetical protein n=1 Tax=Parapedobacter sp. ISTM3 TaxID=2800130 RepID=UPI0019065D2F|nr:hypothetical protein [Parapedobacter sp. ISTM3]MBK1439674.1 hypothetical protein [Parapedobacter sp. ISTM3]
MRNYFIYQYEDVVSSTGKLRVTVLFIHQTKIGSQNELAQELNNFFQEHSITDKLVVLVPNYLDASSLEFFKSGRETTFQRVPGKSADYFDKCLIIYEYDADGSFTLIEGKKPKHESKFISHLLRSGSTVIFKNNGGLVESTPDHHFVFPSNKHCSKFIRTGNVLINQSEIFFLAVQLLKHTKDRNIIYCDTSSINVLPYSVFELRRRFKIEFDCPIVHSFESYDVFEKSTDSFSPESLVLISSSTSGNIIDRLLKEKRADKEQIQVVYFLGPNDKFLNHSANIICNLTKDSEFQLGEEEFETYNNPEDCKLCKNHSRPINIRGDVFLTVQPKVERHLLTIKPEYFAKSIATFAENYKSGLPNEGVIKVYYKDNFPDANYEVYFDIVYLLKNLTKFKRFDAALNRHIDKYIPANTKYLLHLPDIGSEELAKHILTKIPSSIKPELIKLDSDFTSKITEESGTVVIVASCITTGKKLLQISRLMRNMEKLNLVYFVGIYRPVNDKFSTDLISDLKKGKDKSDERPFVAVETIYCSIQQTETSWELEKVFLEDFIGSLDEDKEPEVYSYVNERLSILLDNKKLRGFSNDVFLKTVGKQDLRLRKNFAFWTSFDYKENEIAQSEVYFTISTIISNLEQKQINSHPSLKQTNYVRNMLSPRNFHRFNDGIIQASLLRSGKTEYFAYDLDSELSLQMKEFLLSIIDKYNSADGEALMEFLLAIGIRRLKMRKEDLKEVLNKAIGCPDKIVSRFSEYINKTIA